MIENIPATAKQGRPKRPDGRRHVACLVRVTRDDGSSYERTLGGSSTSSAIYRMQGQPGIARVELIRKLTRDEYRRLRREEAEAAAARPREPRISVDSPCSLIRITRDGVTKVEPSSRYWSEYTRRTLGSLRGVERVELVRRLSRAEYLAMRGSEPGAAAVEADPPPAVPVSPDTDREETAPAPPAPDGPEPDNRGRSSRAPVPGPRPYAWEVVFRRHGLISTTLVVGATEAGAVQLLADLDGVEAAAAIRPLTRAEYRAAVK